MNQPLGKTIISTYQPNPRQQHYCRVQDHVDELLVRCDIREDPSFILSRFKHGLRLEIRKDLIHYHIDSLELAIHWAYEVEQTYRREVIILRPSNQSNIAPSKPTTNPSASEIRPKPKIQQETQRITCFKCNQLGHISRHCPKRALVIREEETLKEPKLEWDHSNYIDYKE